MPRSVQIRFYEELNDFLPPGKRKKTYTYNFTGRPDVRDIIEAEGIPHTEVDLVLVNGESVDLDHHPADGDRISVYPVFESLDISTVTRIRPEPLRNMLFVADVHLGKLSRYLRMLGFDTVYRNDLQDQEIIVISITEKRIILTRDRQLLKNGKVTHGYYLRSDDPRKQLEEVFRRFQLRSALKPFSRCMECNGLMERVDKKEIIEQLQEGTIRDFDEFFRCRACGRIYWKGSHFREMRKMIESLGSS